MDESALQAHNQQASKELSEKIYRLYNASIVCVVNQTTVNANKSQGVGKNKRIGRVPEYYQPTWMYDDAEGHSTTGSRGTIDSNGRGLLKNTSSPALAQGTRPRQSARTPTPDGIQEIEEQSEGSSSNGRIPIAKNGTAEAKVPERMVQRSKKARASENIQSERTQKMLREISDGRVTQRDAIQSSQEKNSGNSGNQVSI